MAAAATDLSLTIDGRTVRARAGATVLEAADAAGVKLPRLCAEDRLSPAGACRLCLVELAGSEKLPAACITPVTDGMVVVTDSPRLAELRRDVMALTLAGHDQSCLICAGAGDCDVQTMAGVVGLRRAPYVLPRAGEGVDASNPYFQFDPSRCVQCWRCVRACSEIQGENALAIDGRGADAQITTGPSGVFFDSDCVSCGACVQSCPTGALIETAVVERGKPERSVDTTCAYCGVGCSLRAELQGDRVVRMTPLASGRANEGHACVKGRFAFGYVDHPDRVLTPMIRDARTDPWRPVGWAEAIDFAAARLKAIQSRWGVGAIGGVSSSRCTNEEVFAVQKLIRAGFGNNNIDTCARVCHAPTGYGLKQSFGTSAGTQDFASVDHADLIFVIGANPSAGHPVFAARLKRRLRQGARLIVADPRRIDLVAHPQGGVHGRRESEAALHLAVRPGGNVALLNALAHVIVTEGLVDRAFVVQRCETESFDAWAAFVADPAQAPEAVAQSIGVAAADIRVAARRYAAAPNAAIYYGLGVTEHSQGSTAVMAIANLAMAAGQIGRPGVGVNPLRGQNNVQGACDMGSFPHEFSGYRSVEDDAVRALFEVAWERELDSVPGLRLPQMLNAARAGQLKGLYIQGEDIAQSDPNSHHVAAALSSLELLIVQDLFLSETAAFAHVFFPGTSFLEKDGTFTNAERRINRVRPALAPRQGMPEWRIAAALATALGYPMHWESSAEIMAEIARLTPSFKGVSHDKLDQLGGLQWPCDDAAPQGTPIMHVDGFARGRGRFIVTPFAPTEERASDLFPLILTTGRILSQYNVGAQTRRTANLRWHDQDWLEIHPDDAAARGVGAGDRVSLASRMGAITLAARLTERVPPGIVYATFHHPESGANIVTTDRADWATSCPEYKVTAVQVTRANDAAFMEDSL